MPIRAARWIAGAAALSLPAIVGAEAQDPRMVEVVALIQGGKPGEAVSRADAMIAQFSAAQHAPGVSYFCNRDRGGVANLLTEAKRGGKVDLAPEAWCEALFAKGFALSGMKRYDEAASALALAVAMDPSNPHFLNQYGDTLRLRGDAPAAMVQYRRAYDLSVADGAESVAPMAARALRGMALAAEGEGDLAAAQLSYEKLLERDAGDAEARARLADVVRRQAGSP